MTNKEILATKSKLLAVINNSQLPITVIQLIVNELKTIVDMATIEALKREELEKKSEQTTQEKEESEVASKEE